MPGTAPRFLFVPVSGPGGAGEYFRSLTVARAVERRWPGCRIRFVLHGAATYARECPYEGPRLDDSPTRSSPAVIACLRQERPDVVIFDSAGRLAQYTAARESGAGVVYVSSRPKTRWKGFRLRRMQVIDQHWIAEPRALGAAPGPVETLKLRLLGRPELVFLDALHEPIATEAVRALQSRLGLEPGRYVLACPGGGGDFGHPLDAVAVFFEAVQRLRAALPIPVVAVLGARGAQASAAVDTDLAHLPNGVLLGLVHDAAVAAVNGGSLLLQSLVQRVPVVAAPIAGDQAARIRRCAAMGCVTAVPLDAAAIADAVMGLQGDPIALVNMRTSSERLGLRNGADVVVDAIERLLGQAGRRREDRA